MSEEELELEFVLEDGSLDVELFKDIYQASVNMVMDLIVFLEENGFQEDDFRTWRDAYYKRTMN
jgi:hypothetical protein